MEEKRGGACASSGRGATLICQLKMKPLMKTGGGYDVIHLRSVARRNFKFGKSVPKLEGRRMMWNSHRFISTFRASHTDHPLEFQVSSFICNLVLPERVSVPIPSVSRNGIHGDVRMKVSLYSFRQAQIRTTPNLSRIRVTYAHDTFRFGMERLNTKYD
jgi:hypothetical protein